MSEPILFPYQVKGKTDTANLFRKGFRKVLDVLPGGGGKCLGVDTPVLMYSGEIKKVQDIIVGDKLMGENSFPRNVLSTTIGYGELFKVNPVKGDSYVVNRDHILSLKIGSGEDNINVEGRNYKAKDIVNISVDEYFKSSKWFKTCAKGWKTGVEFDYKKLTLDPYFLGLWLGDGNSGTVTFTTGDIEIKEYLKEYAKSNLLDIRIEPNSKNSEMYFFRNKNFAQGKIDGIRTLFQDLNLFNNKHIPFHYKTSSRYDRLQLLAGILDADGSLGKGCFDFISKYESFSNDVCFLARSLGFSAYLNKCRKYCYYKGEKKENDYYRVCIGGDVNLIPNKIDRKKSYVRKMNKNILTVGIKSIDYIGNGNYYGFEIDGNHLFLLGDFTVTHNTFISSSITKDYHIKQKPLNFDFDYSLATGKKVAVFTHREELFGQWRDSQLKFGNITEPINADTNNINPNSDTFIAMVETFSRRSDSDFFLQHFKNVGLVFIDEAHRDDFNKILHHFDQSLIIGLTATPISSNKKRPMNSVWDVMLEIATRTELLSLNEEDNSVGIVPCDCYSLGKINREGLKKKGLDFDDKIMSKDFRDKKQKSNTLENYFEHGKGMKGLCFNVDVEHNEDMDLEFKSAGIESRQLHSLGKKWFGAPSESLSKNWRKDTILWFKSTPASILHNIGILTTGYDERSVELVMTNYASLSISKVEQSHTRGSRTYKYPNGEWKQFYRWLDFGRNCEYFNIDGNNNINWKDYFDSPLSTHNRDGVGGYKSCPECGALNPVAARFCKGIKEDWLSMEKLECGYAFPLSLKEEDLVPRMMVKFFSDGISVSDLCQLARINGWQLTSVYFKILDSVSYLAKRSFSSFLVGEQFDFLVDMAFKKVKELSKITGKRACRDNVRKSLIEKLRKDGFVIDVEEIGESGILEDLKNEENKNLIYDKI